MGPFIFERYHTWYVQLNKIQTSTNQKCIKYIRCFLFSIASLELCRLTKYDNHWKYTLSGLQMSWILHFLSVISQSTSSSLCVMQNCQFHVYTIQTLEDLNIFKSHSLIIIIIIFLVCFQGILFYIYRVRWLYASSEFWGGMTCKYFFIMVLCATLEIYCLKCNILFFLNGCLFMMWNYEMVNKYLKS